MVWPASRFLLILALIFFVIDAMLLGGIISGSNLQWLLPAGLAAWVLATLVP